MHIHFQSESEAIILKKLVSGHPYGAELHSHIHFSSDLKLIVRIKENNAEKMLSMLSDVFYSYLLKEKLSNVLEDIVTKKFFFQEREEVEAITDIAHSIIEGEKNKNKKSLFGGERAILEEGLRNILLEKDTFSFDSFATFRLKSFYGTLLHYAGLAIDEYKLEQDYQNFIASLRDMLNERQPKAGIIHLLHDNGFHFYNDKCMKMDKQEVYRLIDRKLMSEKNPFYIDSSVLAPLISIAPSSLHLYTNESEDGLIRTISRIFEERTVIKPLHTFSEQNGFA
ncbi:sporulation protein YtxC [Peribacillus sp. B-H-3]|uniref:sporulation protein YtxC n=1 Tax=Peribacillus sp. B-H-3 TaxID=3400420 RepID=UPI003B01A502